MPPEETVLETERLRLRIPNVNDIPLIVRYANDKAVADNILNIRLPYTQADAETWLNFSLAGIPSRERFVFAITEKDSPDFAGVIALHISREHLTAQLAYWLGSPFRGKGYIAEAATELIRFGFTEEILGKIYATCFTGNTASVKILEGLGMIREGELKDHYIVNGIPKNVYQYRLTREEYFAAR